MKKVLFGLFILLIPCISVNASPVEAELISCNSANSYTFKINSEERTLKLLAVKVEDKYKNDVCSLIKDEKIKIEYENDSEYDNAAWIYINGDLLQEKIIANGYGEVINPNRSVSYVKELCNVEAKALNNKRGIWNNNKQEQYCNSIIHTSDEEIIENEEKSFISKLFDENSMLSFAFFILVVFAIVMLIKRSNRSRRDKIIHIKNRED